MYAPGDILPDGRIVNADPHDGPHSGGKVAIAADLRDKAEAHGWRVMAIETGNREIVIVERAQ